MSKYNTILFNEIGLRKNVLFAIVVSSFLLNNCIVSSKTRSKSTSEDVDKEDLINKLGKFSQRTN